MSRRRRIVVAILAFLAVAAGIWWFSQPPAAVASIRDVPPAARAAAHSALARAGYQPAAAPVWAGASAVWQTPGRYRLFFSAAGAIAGAATGANTGVTTSAASDPAGAADIYVADVRVDGAGQVSALGPISKVTDTAAGEEDPPALVDGWLAYATRVGGQYQTVTCVASDDLGRLRVFALQRPAQRVDLAWSTENGGPALIVQVAWATDGGVPDGRMPSDGVPSDGAPELTARLVIDPVTPQVLAGAPELTYQPEVQGEQAWLPLLVSKVRNLPFVGPEKIAFLENVFFTAEDRIARLTHPAAQATDQPAAPATAGPGALLAGMATMAPEPGRSPAAVAFPPATETSVLTATPAGPEPTAPAETATAVATTAPTATAAPGAAPTLTPTPTLAPTATRPLPVPSRAAPPTAAAASAAGGRPLPEGLAPGAALSPDPERPYAAARAVLIDPGLLQIKMVHGTWEPVSTTGLTGGSGTIPQSDWPALVAGFNGGFAAMHGQFGMMVDRKIYLPAREGIATLAVYEDGSIRMGTWGKDLRQTADMVSFRQNCPPLIENGNITAETGKLTLWGLSVSNAVYLYRSGLGMTEDGRLVYVAGKPLSAYTLARALQQAGAVYAMQLDVDEYHVAFITYDVQPAAAGTAPVVTGTKLSDDMHGFDGYFLRPFALDFFYLTRRPQRLEAAVRLAPAGSGSATGAVAQVPDLPGRIAFASNRDGLWQIYAMPAAQPAQVSRLTQNPGGALYPAWSPDGKRLAFTSRRDGNAEIYVTDVAGPGASPGADRRITNQPSEEWAPTWSPDGTRLAYQSDRDGQSDIYVSGVDAGGETLVTQWQGNNEAPDWAPGGGLIAFDSDLDVDTPVHASINVYLMGADGSNPTRLITAGESPAWSPDGKAVAFASQRTGQWQVFAQNVDGSGLLQLSKNGANARYPAWSPDGRWLAFASDREGHWEIYVVPADGGDPLRVTAGAGDSSYPDWGP